MITLTLILLTGFGLLLIPLLLILLPVLIIVGIILAPIIIPIILFIMFILPSIFAGSEYYYLALPLLLLAL